MSNKILVTGGCGFVGSNLIGNLLEKGNEVAVLDNMSNGLMSYLAPYPKVEVFRADITQPDLCLLAFKNIDTVVHLAAYGSVVESVANPAINFQINAQGTLNVLDLCVKNEVKKIVFASTGGALIGNALPPVSELSLPKPVSPYGASKLVGEAYCHAYAESYGIRSLCLRFANVYGPNSAHKKGVVNKFAQRIMEKKPLTIFGDGKSTRDYIHVSDLCDGICAAVDDTQLRNEVMHLATGRETSLLELARLFLSLEDMDISNIIFEPTRPGEVEKNFALFAYAHEKLGYSPTISLEEGLASTYDYLKTAYAA